MTFPMANPAADRTANAGERERGGDFARLDPGGARGGMFPFPNDVPAFGAMSSRALDHVYWFGERGLLYTSPWVVTASTERQSAVVLLTASGRRFELTLDGRVVHHAAVAIAPLTRRGLCAVDLGLVSVNVEPHHPVYGVFCGIAEPGVRALDRSTFRRFDADLVRAYEGRLAHRESERLFEGVVEVAAAQIRASLPRGERSDALETLVLGDPDRSLAEIARALGVSCTTASHLFTRTFGLRFRSYQHWRKCTKADERLSTDLPLTQIAQQAGFADLAHLSRSWKRRYGLSPSYLRDREHVRIIG